MPHFAEGAPLAVVNRDRPLLTVPIEDEYRRFIETRAVERRRSVTEVMAVEAQTRDRVSNEPRLAQGQDQPLLKIPGMEMQQCLEP